MLRVLCALRGGHRLLCVAACLGVLALGSAAPALAPIPLPPLADQESGRYRARDATTGADLWEVAWEVRKTVQDGAPVFDFAEQGRGFRQPELPSTWTMQMQIALWAPDPHLTADREAQAADGTPRLRERRDFDYARGQGAIRTTDVRTGETTTTTVALTAHTVPPELMGAALRVVPDRPGQRLRVDVPLRNGFVLGLDARVVGQEDVTVPAGTFPCYKIRLDPTGVAGMVGTVLRFPPILMWHTVAAPHVWVKYQGPEAGPRSREIVRELVAFHAQ